MQKILHYIVFGNEPNFCLDLLSLPLPVPILQFLHLQTPFSSTFISKILFSYMVLILWEIKSRKGITCRQLLLSGLFHRINSLTSTFFNGWEENKKIVISISKKSYSFMSQIVSSQIYKCVWKTMNNSEKKKLWRTQSPGFSFFTGGVWRPERSWLAEGHVNNPSCAFGYCFCWHQTNSESVWSRLLE